MARFTDTLGREWDVRLDIATVRRLREDCPERIKVTDPEQLAALLDDECLQYVVMWEICKSQAVKHNVDEQAFSVIFTESYATAGKALVQALTDFFLCVGKTDLSAIAERTLNASARLLSLREKKIRSETTEKIIEGNLAKAEQEMDNLLSQALTEATTPVTTAAATTETTTLADAAPTTNG